MSKQYKDWFENINLQADFYKKNIRKSRVDKEFEWTWLKKHQNWRDRLKPYIGSLSNSIRRRVAPYSRKWFSEKADLLWSTRQILDDDLSKLLFDSYLILRMTDYSKYFYPRFNYDDIVSIINDEEFVSSLPRDYGGLPLKYFKIAITNSKQLTQNVKIISTRLQIGLLNNYRQYFVKRGYFNFIPNVGSVVFDCGSCIGDVSMIFSAFVGNTGEVHTFDPIPLHNKYAQLHSDLNPDLGDVLRINTLAVDCSSSDAQGGINDSKSISPGGCVVNNFKKISLDDYVLKNIIKRIDYIKMDIEGSEISALSGATTILRDMKPKLAISAYHKPEDLWEIPALIKKLNPDYKIFFGHHSPIHWEAVYYAA